ncbi:MAG: LysE family transporter [Alphaproteobacteria bacterium]|nr:LysE family transporter [Alphaproteobacteria bacterium]
MLENLNLGLIMGAALLAVASPGPATLGIANTSMNSGRVHGLAFASGIATGSWAWNITAALGLSSLLLSHIWLLEIMRYFGAAYLLYLAIRSLRASFKSKKSIEIAQSKLPQKPRKLRHSYLKGLAIHLTNPKAILFFGSLYSIGLPAEPSFSAILTVCLSVGLLGMTVFFGYVFLFSSPPMVKTYSRLQRWFELFFAAAFGFASIKIFLARL